MHNQVTYEISAERMEHFRNLESDCKLLRRQLAEEKAKSNDQYLASLEKRVKRLEDDAEFDRFLESIQLED